MKRFAAITVCSVLFFVLFSAASAPAAEHEGISKVHDAVEVVEQLVSIPEKGIPPLLLKNASGIAIIPGVIKAGFIVGGRYGTGVLMVRNKEGEWSNPTFVTLAGGSIGWQIGVESIDIILVFKSDRSIDGIVRGKFTLGVDAGVAAGPVGREAKAATDIQLKAEIYSYSRSRGLFAGLALEGSGLQIDHDANAAFYGKATDAREIFAGKDLKVPPAAEKLKKLVADYASK